MRSYNLSGRTKRPIQPEDEDNLATRLSEMLIGQPDAIEKIVPYIQMHQAGLAPEGRPIGVVLLLGPTGTSILIRLSAFIVLCIGIQIMVNGLQDFYDILKHPPG